jgi:mannose-1-phosphate guanylyltransferase
VIGSGTAGVGTVTRSLWSVVLAAGAGRRLNTLTGGVPKQFWSPGGGPSLLDATLSRLAPLSGPERTVVVVDRSHLPHVQLLSPGRVGAVLFQPSDRGTAAGVMLALTPVLDADPEAVVVLTPSDHGLRDAGRFQSGVLGAVELVRRDDRVVLFGVAPTHANDDYGWIVPGPIDDMGGLRPVREFVEKPPASEAARLLAQGALWNTMVVVARVATLRALFAEHLSELTRVFDAARQLPLQAREGYLAQAYSTMETWDFSRDLLTPARNLLVHTWPRALGWSDLGTPERIAAWCLGRAPARVGHAVDAA